MWADAIKKEIKNVCVAFKPLKNGIQSQNRYQFVQCHMIFDVKMGNFHMKARLVTGGHMMDVPPTTTYASVVSCETICIALTIAALNALRVMATDIMNVYITALNKEKIWTLLGPKFGNDKGCKAIVVRALSGLKSANVA